MQPKTLLTRIAGILVAGAVLVYAADFLWFEYRMRNSKPTDPLETITFYYATDIKGGKEEILYDQPQTEICTHSIFPHAGYKPCWRCDRSGIQRISAFVAPPRSERKGSGGRCRNGDRPRVVFTHRAHGKEMIIGGYAL